MGACTLMGSIYQIFSGMFLQSVGDFSPFCGPDCDVDSDVDDLKLVAICDIWWLNFDYGNIFSMLVSNAYVER